jgi:signal transduction histidine kinase
MADAAPTPSPLAHEVAAMRQRIADLEAALAAQQALVQALRARQDAAAQIVETVREPLLLLDPHFRVQSANPAFYRTFQVTPAETEGQLLSQLDHGAWDMPAVRTLLEELLPQQTIVTDYEVTQSFARIGRRTLLLNARCLDAVQRILLAIEDITLHKHAETRLQQQQTRLARQMQEQMAALHHDMAERQRLEREAQRVQHFATLGRLAAGLSHEMRNPLAAVFLYVDLLAEELHDPAPSSATAIDQALTAIKTHLARVDDRLQDYLALVRVATLPQAPVDLTTVVTQWAQEITPLLTAQGITLQLDALDQLGTVMLHPPTLRRALLHLVHNAMEAMPHGGTLTLGGRRQATTVHLEVRDTGIGMPPEHLTRMFEPLQTTKPGGTGLGLYLVQEVVAAHGGQIAVQSTVGHGTTMTITLPLGGT